MFLDDLVDAEPFSDLVSSLTLPWRVEIGRHVTEDSYHYQIYWQNYNNALQCNN